MDSLVSVVAPMLDDMRFNAERWLIEADRHMVREQGLRALIPLAWPVLEGLSKPYSGNWHIDAICEHLTAVSRGQIKRLAISMPPRHMKSLSVSVAWLAWDWIDNPWRQFLFTSYAQNLAFRDSVKTRRLVSSPWYVARWGDRFRIVDDQNTKSRFENNKTGHRLSTSVGGGTTGEGGDIIVCLPGDEIVWTERGPLPIEQIVRERDAGLRAWAFDTATGAYGLKPIVGWHINPGRPILRVTLSDGSSFRCTADHQIWTRRGWVDAGLLKSCDMLPNATFAYVRDRRLVDGKLPGQLPLAQRTGGDKADVAFGELGVAVPFAPPMVAVAPEPVSSDAPCQALPDLPDRGGLHAQTLGDDVSLFVALHDLDSLRSGQFGPGATFFQREGAVLFSVRDVLGARAVFEVAEPGIRMNAALVPHLLPGRRRSDEGQHDNLMDYQRDGLTVAPGVEARVAMVGRCLEQPAGDCERLPFAQDGSRPAAHAGQVGNLIVREARDRSPLLIEIVEHPAQTFCLTVADWHTMLVGIGHTIMHQCDDAHNVRSAESEKVRTGTLEWWDEALSSRCNDPKTGAYVLVQQRVHEDDLMGHVLKQQSVEPWEVLCLPAEFEPDHPQRWFRDPRKELGELLWPSRIGRREVEDLKQRLGPYAAAAQLQQRPSPRAGGIFKHNWFPQPYLPVAPEDTVWVRGWDFAGTAAKVVKADPDYTASAKVGWSAALSKWIIGDVTRMREEAHVVERLVVEQAERDGTAVQIQLAQDPGQAGKGQAQNYLRLLAKFTASAQPVTGDKMARALTWAGKAGSGMVLLVQGDWTKPFLDELTSFPTGAHDDQVDAVSSAFDRLVNNSFGLIDYYEQQLRQRGIDPGAIRTPLQRQEDAAEAERQRKEGTDADLTAMLGAFTK